jgi:alpha-tubulin suppressor-like RCC1 family protein
LAADGGAPVPVVDAATAPEAAIDAADARTIDLPLATPRLAAGGMATCAIDGDGATTCWGDNNSGQLGSGDASRTSSSVPVVVQNLGRADAVFGGPASFCARDASSRVQCWGDTIYGQFDTTPHVHAITFAPLVVDGLGDDVAQVAIGTYFDFALTRAGRAKVWGLNGVGQLGLGNDADAYTPADVPGFGAPLVAIAASSGGFFACGVDADRGAGCWGDNAHGQLAHGTANTNAPVRVDGAPPNVVMLAAGASHACALVGDGSVLCWGDNGEGQLGDGSTISRAAPAAAGPLPRVRSIAAGGARTCAITEDGDATCWGEGDTRPVSRASDVVEIAVGLAHACVRKRDDSLHCWGDDSAGQLGPYRQ